MYPASAVLSVVLPGFLMLWYTIMLIAAVATTSGIAMKACLFFVYIFCLFLTASNYWGYALWQMTCCFAAVFLARAKPSWALVIGLFALWSQLMLLQYFRVLLGPSTALLRTFVDEPRGDVILATFNTCANYYGTFRKSLLLVPWDADPETFPQFYGLCSYEWLTATRVCDVFIIAGTFLLVVQLGLATADEEDASPVPAKQPANNPASNQGGVEMTGGTYQ